MELISNAKYFQVLFFLIGQANVLLLFNKEY